MTEILRLAPAMSRAIEIIEAPGFLRGRQREKVFKGRVYTAVEYILKMFTRYDKTFVLCLRETSRFLKMHYKQFWVVLNVLKRMGLVTPTQETMRRWEAGTVSPTLGSNEYWFLPGVYRLGDIFADFFPDRPGIGTNLADSPSKTDAEQRRLTTLTESRKGHTGNTGDSEEEDGTGFALRSSLAGQTADEDCIDAVDIASEGSPAVGNASGQGRGPKPAPGRLGAPGAEDEAPPADPAILAVAEARRALEGGKLILSSEALSKTLKAIRDPLRLF